MRSPKLAAERRPASLLTDMVVQAQPATGGGADAAGLLLRTELALGTQRLATTSELRHGSGGDAAAGLRTRSAASSPHKDGEGLAASSTRRFATAHGAPQL